MRINYARIARTIAAAAMVTGLATAVVHTQPAQASTSYGNAALNWAEAHGAGHWYGWGGTGPAVFDCSGLVYASMLHTNPHWPSSVRTTYAMIAWLYAHARVVPVSQAQRGDLLFFGSGHVEFATIWHHTSFGAQQTGTRVWWHSWSGWWAPTMAFRV